MDYDIVYSNRKTIALSVRGAKLTVRAPKGTPEEYIESLIKKHILWINRRLSEQQKRKLCESELSAQKISELKEMAKTYFNLKSIEYAQIMGLKFSRIEISSAKRKFGSCNSKGVIRFAYRLMLYPEAAREYVIVHELAHLVHMNHSRDFYRLVEKFMPDYKARVKLLKQ